MFGGYGTGLVGELERTLRSDRYVIAHCVVVVAALVFFNRQPKPIINHAL